MSETSTLQDIIKTKKIIKKKLLELKRGKEEKEQLLTETFKPIVTPLSQLSASLGKLQWPESKNVEKMHVEDEVFETPMKNR